MSLDTLNNAFKLLESLNEELFDTSLDGLNKLSSVMDGDDTDDIIKIVDAEAETEEELQDSYVGKVIVTCNVCHSYIFKNKDELSIDEDGLVNGEETCPYCGEQEGFTIVGQISEFDNEEDTEEDDDKDTTSDDTSVKVDGEEVEVENKSEQKNESIRGLRKSGKRLVESATDVTDQVEINIKEPGFISKKKALEKQGYRVLHTGDGKITMCKDKKLKEASEQKAVGPTLKKIVETRFKKYIAGEARYIVGSHNGYSVEVVFQLKPEIDTADAEEKIEEIVKSAFVSKGYKFICKTPFVPFIIDGSTVRIGFDIRDKKLYESEEGEEQPAQSADGLSAEDKKKAYFKAIRDSRVGKGKNLFSKTGKATSNLDKVTAPRAGEKLTEAPYYLDTKYDSRKSFYNKAMVSDDTDDLYSYGVHVMSIKDGKPVIMCREDQLTQTTLRHIKEFLKQKGFDAISKQQIIRDYMVECAGTKTVEEGLSESKYRNVILNHFGFSASDEFLDVISDLIDRVDDFSNEDDIWEAVDSGMIYTKDQWTVYMHYCDMGDPVDTMWENLFGDVLAICGKISEDAPTELDESLKTAMKEKLTKRLKEGFNNVNVETDDQKLTMTQDDSGKVTVTTEPITSDETLSDETIAPVSDELANEIMDGSEDVPAADDADVTAEMNSEETPVEEPTDDTTSEEVPEEGTSEEDTEGKNESLLREGAEEAHVDLEIEDLDEESFNTLSEKYLKRVYENVESFNTTAVSSNETKMVVEGVITFKSGVKKKTGFIFEASTASKDGAVRFLGENKHFSNSNKAFSLTGKVVDKKLVVESLRYNYKHPESSDRLMGRVTRRSK